MDTIYIFSPNGDGVFMATTSAGAPLYQYGAYGDAADGEAVAVYIKRQLQDTHPASLYRYVYVVSPRSHSIVKTFLTQEESTPKEAVPIDTHLCSTCVHSSVCLGAEAADKLEFKISACTPHIAVPQEPHDA